MSRFEITSEIFQVGGGPLTAPEDAAIYLIHVEGQAALVDAGCGGETERLLANIGKCGVPSERIGLLLLTHCHFDHTGGARELKERLTCRTVVHEFDAGFLERGDNRATAANWYGCSMRPLEIDLKLTGARSTILLRERTIEAIHTPGHTPGSLVFLMESEGQKVLFGQDVHGPLDASFHSNRNDYLDSLRLLISLEADILCEGHYGIFRGKKKVADFIRQFAED
jgi:glyoxylase-like metal-dependent hydrolase (beta-lactamase superfamily II)